MSHQYRKSRCGDDAILQPSYLCNVNSYTNKTFWIESGPWYQCAPYKQQCVNSVQETDFPQNSSHVLVGSMWYISSILSGLFSWSLGKTEQMPVMKPWQAVEKLTEHKQWETPVSFIHLFVIIYYSFIYYSFIYLFFYLFIYLFIYFIHVKTHCWTNKMTFCICPIRIVKVLYPDTKVHGANMGPIWGRQDPGGPHVGPMNLIIWVAIHWSPMMISMQRSSITICSFCNKRQIL